MRPLCDLRCERSDISRKAFDAGVLARVVLAFQANQGCSPGIGLRPARPICAEHPFTDAAVWDGQLSGPTTLTKRALGEKLR